MIIKEEVYWEVEANEKVLIELMNSKVVKRVSGISQLGFFSRYYWQSRYARYEDFFWNKLLLMNLNEFISCFGDYFDTHRSFLRGGDIWGLLTNEH
jgi:hypothetical protein